MPESISGQEAHQDATPHLGSLHPAPLGPHPATLPTVARPHGSLTCLPTEPAHSCPCVPRAVAHSACQQASCDKPEEPANVSSLRKINKSFWAVSAIRVVAEETQEPIPSRTWS